MIIYIAHRMLCRGCLCRIRDGAHREAGVKETEENKQWHKLKKTMTMMMAAICFETQNNVYHSSFGSQCSVAVEIGTLNPFTLNRVHHVMTTIQIMQKCTQTQWQY